MRQDRSSCIRKSGDQFYSWTVGRRRIGEMERLQGEDDRRVLEANSSEGEV